MIAQKKVFYALENIANLYDAGIPFIEAFESVATDSDPKIRKALMVVVDKVRSGISIGQAIREQKLFPEYAVSLIQIGEESGTLQEHLQLVLINEEKRFALQSKMVSVLGYPIFVLVLTVVIGLGVAWFILPRMAEAFSDLNVALPIQTQIIIQIGNFFATYGIIFVPATLISLSIIFWIIFVYSKTRFIGQKILLKIPVINAIIRANETSRMGFLMGSLLNAGYPFSDSLQLVANTTKNIWYQKFYLKVGELVDEGRSISDLVQQTRQINELFSKDVIRMIIYAEKSGSYPETFNKIGKRYEKRLYELARQLPGIIEPLLLIGVWIGVLILAFAIIGPMYSIYEGLQISQ